MQKDKKIHFNVIDILIILAGIIVVAGFSFYATGAWREEPDTTLDNTQPVVKYTFLVKNVEPLVCDLIEVGDQIREASKDTVKGTVTKILNVDNYVEFEAFDADKGIVTPAKHPYYRTVEIEIESPCTLVNNAAYIEDMEIKVGKQVNLKSSKYAFAGYIISVDVTEE